MEVTIGLWRESCEDSTLGELSVFGEELFSVGEERNRASLEIFDVVFSNNSFFLSFRSVFNSSLLFLLVYSLFFFSLLSNLLTLTIRFRNRSTHLKFLSSDTLLHSSSISPDKFIFKCLNCYRPVISMSKLFYLLLVSSAVFVYCSLNLFSSNIDTNSSSLIKFTFVDLVLFTDRVNFAFEVSNSSVDLLILNPFGGNNALNTLLNVRSNLVLNFSSKSVQKSSSFLGSFFDISNV